MNFIEAIKAIKKGKSVSLNGMIIPATNNPSFEFKISKGGFSNGAYTLFISEDWEIVDDDWNLTDKINHNINWKSHPKITMEKYLKKCRDLILEDLNDMCPEMFGKTIKTSAEMNVFFTQAKVIINKRFGDLK